MKTYLDCLPCLMSQALKAARAATDDEKVQRQVVNAIAAMIPELSLGLKPPEIAQRSYRLIGQITGNNDPLHQAKVEANRTALALWPKLKQLVEQTADRLFMACRLAILANSIDFGPNFEHGGIEAIIDEARMCSIPLAVDNYDQFWSSLENSRSLLYLGDNAGEIVFDRILIEEIHRVKELETCFVVREKPVINDVTMDDALAVGMDRVAKVISNGSDAPATILSQCSAELQHLFRSADIIIAKGQGNYESLEGEPDNIFFLLRAKCPLMAGLLGVSVGDCVLKRQVNG
jgi:damage-control phosphatase, subfamily I